MLKKNIEEINELKKNKNAYILAHYYQNGEIQDIADVIGDSFYLSKKARDSDSDFIIFCGVKFMAESAKIVSPEKRVFLPAADSGCPMADMADYEEVLKLKNIHKDAAFVCYINSNSDVKTLCDVCVTSSNALKVIKRIDNKKIVFLPDKNLGEYISRQIPEKEFILWEGFCITHKKIKADSVEKAKKNITDIIILTHPECEKTVRDISDFIGSTGEIIDYVKKTDFKNYLIVTESGVIHTLKKETTGKNFFTPGGEMVCQNMKKTKLEDILNVLQNEVNEIKLESRIIEGAARCLQAMHKLAE